MSDKKKSSKNVEEKPRDPKAEKREKALRIVNIAVLMAIFAGVTLFMTFGKRPNVSYTENRNLEKPPEFTWEGYWSGYVTDQFSKYYNDTVPERAAWKLFISNFRAHLGVKYGNGVTIVGEVPVIDNHSKPDDTSKPANSVPEVVIKKPEDGGASSNGDASSNAVSSSSNPKVPAVVIPKPSGTSDTTETTEPTESEPAPDNTENTNPNVPAVVIPSRPTV